MSRLTAYSAGENETDFENTPDLRFVVILEPTRGPHISGDISLSSQRFTYSSGIYDQERDEFIR